MSKELVGTNAIWYTVRYAQKVKADPKASLVYRIDGAIISPYPSIDTTHITDNDNKLTGKTKLLLLIFLFTFLGMIAGVVLYDWWLLEMTALFLASSVLLAVVLHALCINGFTLV